MKIFTEKAFENRLARERERLERDRYIMERLDKLTADLNELTWRVNELKGRLSPEVPTCNEVLKCEARKGD